MNEEYTKKFLRLTDEKRILELENDIDELTMSNQSIDREALNHIDAIVHCLVTTSLSIHKDIAAIKSMKRVENTIEKWREDRDTTTDEVCVGCCKVVDIAADLQTKLDKSKLALDLARTTHGGTIKYLRGVCDTRDKTIEELEHKLGIRTKQVGHYANAVAGRGETILELKRKLDGVSAAFDDQNSAIEGIEAELSAKNKIIDERNGHIDAYSHVIVSREANIAYLEVDKERMNTVIEGLEAELNTMKETINDLREQIHNQSTSIDGLIKESVRMDDRHLECLHTIKGLKAELSARKEDSEVLMKVVDIVKDCDDTGRVFTTCRKLTTMLDDYLDAPEAPEDTTVDELEFDVDWSPDEGYSITTTPPDGEKRYLLLGIKP